MSNTKSAPNVNILPKPIGVNLGIKRGAKLPKELTPRKLADPWLPYLSAPRILNKAEKWATSWYNRTKELEEADAYHERVRLQLNIPETGVPMTQQEAKIVNIDEIAKSVTRGINDNIAPRPPPDPQRHPSRPPSSRGTSTQTDNVAQINPLTKEISTTSTQTMREMANASTSAVPTVSSGGTQTDLEPPVTGGELAMMSLDAPLQQIVHHYHNYHTTNQYLQQQHNQLNQLNQYATLNSYNQVMNDNRSVQNVLHNNLVENNILQQIDNRQAIHNQLTIEAGTLPSAPGVIQNWATQMLLVAPPNQPVRPSRLLQQNNPNAILLKPPTYGLLGNLPDSRKEKPR